MLGTIANIIPFFPEPVFCERHSTAFIAEPINAITNIAFLLVTYLVECSHIAISTYFLWHIFNSLAAYVGILYLVDLYKQDEDSVNPVDIGVTYK